jgi:hypothetical protein
MALKKFFLSNGVFSVGDFDAIPSGMYYRKIDANDFIRVYKVGMPENDLNLLIQGHYSDFCDVNGDAYASLAAFKTGSDGFFVSASRSGGIQPGTPVNAVAAKVVATVNSRPDDYVKLKRASSSITVVTQPNVNVQADGTITVAGTPQVDEHLAVFDVEFHFKALRSGAGEITIDADNDVQAANIAAAILADVEEVIPEVVENVVTVTAIEEAPYVGAGGNVIVLTTNATGIAVSGAGTLTNGVTADTITLNGVTYTFIPEGEVPGINEIALGADQEGTAANIAATGPQALYTLVADGADVDISAVVNGAAGNNQAYNVDGARITDGAGGVKTTLGGTDEVKSYLTINGIDYVFADSALEDPETDYPLCKKIATAAAATMTQIAAALVAKLKLDISAFSSTSVSNLNEVATIGYKTKGVIGNAVGYVNNLVVPGDITDDSVDDLFTGGVDGTVAGPGTMLADSNFKYYTIEGNGISDANWLKENVGVTF